MDSYELDINENVISAEREEEYRQRRRQRRLERRNRRQGETRVEPQQEKIAVNSTAIRIGVCIVAGVMGAMLLKSNGESSAQAKRILTTALDENISIESFVEFKDKLLRLNREGGNAKKTGITVESDYLDMMNEEDSYYRNQKK